MAQRKLCAECPRRATHRVRLGFRHGRVRAVLLACEHHARRWFEVDWREHVRVYRFRRADQK